MASATGAMDHEDMASITAIRDEVARIKGFSGADVETITKVVIYHWQSGLKREQILSRMLA